MFQSHLNFEDAESLKHCFKCGQMKARQEFYRHSQMSDGLLGKCKECTRADVVANRAAKIEYYREYDKKRFNTPERKATRSKQSVRTRTVTPEKYRARNAVNNAIRDGRLVRQPCEKCGNTKVDAHHDDYSQPLNVRWLCRTCHLKEHGNYTECA